MKKGIDIRLIVIVSLFVHLAFTVAAFGQREEPDKKAVVRIEVVEEVNGRTIVTKRSFNVGDLSEDARMVMMDKVLDSLRKNPSPNRRITVTVDERNAVSEKGNRFGRRGLVDRDQLIFGDSILMGIDSLWRGRKLDYFKFRNDLKQFEADMRPKLKDFAKQMELGRYLNDDRKPNFPDIQEFYFAPFHGNSGEGFKREKPSSIQQLDVYANKPDDGTLNLRFIARQKGDVTITVEDTKGKEVGRKELKEYTGEFVGQIALKRKLSGTVFVKVVQLEDGAVKRIVLSGL